MQNDTFINPYRLRTTHIYVRN